MKSHTTRQFWHLYDRLPADVQLQADRAYELWTHNPFHPSLRFKRVDPQEPIYSARINRGYRSLGWLEENVVTWFWIGNHDDYKRIIR